VNARTRRPRGGDHASVDGATGRAYAPWQVGAGAIDVRAALAVVNRTRFN
jgi:hypothetical protein